MSKKINIGVLGCANFAKTHLIPNLLNLNSHYSLVGVASRTEKKQKTSRKCLIQNVIISMKIYLILRT